MFEEVWDHIPGSPAETARLEQMTVPLREAARLMGKFREYLIEAGFTTAGAESIVDSYAITVWHSDDG